jgi:hypothetical protein
LLGHVTVDATILFRLFDEPTAAIFAKIAHIGIFGRFAAGHFVS